MDGDTKDGLKIEIRPRFRADSSEVQFTNYLRFSLVGTDIVMDIGVIDPDRMVALARDPSLTPEADADILKRYGMSLNTLALLKRQVDEIWQKIDVSKAFDPDLYKK